MIHAPWSMIHDSHSFPALIPNVWIGVYFICIVCTIPGHSFLPRYLSSTREMGGREEAKPSLLIIKTRRIADDASEAAMTLQDWWRLRTGTLALSWGVLKWLPAEIDKLRAKFFRREDSAYWRKDAAEEASCASKFIAQKCLQEATPWEKPDDCFEIELSFKAAWGTTTTYFWWCLRLDLINSVCHLAVQAPQSYIAGKGK